MAGLVLGAAILVAIVQNGHRVRVHYLAWHLSVSLIVVVLTTALAAVLLDEIGGLIWRRRRRSMLHRRTELEQLRATPTPPPDEPEPIKTADPAPDDSEAPPVSSSIERGPQ